MNIYIVGQNGGNMIFLQANFKIIIYVTFTKDLPEIKVFFLSFI